MPRALSPPLHEFQGSGHRCALKTCQQGRTGAAHRKPRDMPEARLEVAEAKIKRLEAAFDYLNKYTATLETCLRMCVKIAGSSISQQFDADRNPDKVRPAIFKILDRFEAKYAKKAPQDPTPTEGG